jgi:hypothetical protein
MSEYLHNTFKKIFSENNNKDGKVGHIITDIASRQLLNRFYSLDQLILKGVIAVFDIVQMIQKDKQDILSDQSKSTLYNNNVMYLITSELLDKTNNLSKKEFYDLLELQLKYFGKDVQIIFTGPINESILKNISQINHADKISSIKSLPYNTNMFFGKALLSEAYHPVIKQTSGYHLIVPDTNQKIWDQCLFNIQMKEKTQNILEPSAGMYSSLIISLPRSYDMITPYMIPWVYESMVGYYLNFKQDIISETSESQMIISANTDKFWNELKHLNYDDLSIKITEIANNLTKQTAELKELIKKGNIPREKMHEFTETNKSMVSIKCHIKILEIINKSVEEFNSIILSNLQAELLRGNGSKSIIEKEINQIIKTKKLDNLNYLMVNKSLKSVINLAHVLGIDTNITITINDSSLNLHALLDPIVEHVKQIKISDIVKTDGIKSMVKNIVDISSPKTETDILLGVNSLIDRKQPNQLISHIPVLKILINHIIDNLNNSVTGGTIKNININPKFINMKIIKSQILSNLDTIIIHIDNMISYEELRILEAFVSESKKISQRINNIKFVLHSSIIN